MNRPLQPNWAETFVADNHGWRASATINHVEFIFRWVPAGEDTLGSPETEESRFTDEEQYKFQTAGFWMADSAVTNAQWAVVMQQPPPAESEANLPKTQINFFEAQQYTEKLSSLLNCNSRLPTEAEWEYACRAGTDGPTYGPINEIAVYGTTHVAPVKTKKPNAWGLYDMLGNVWEWCA